MRMCLSVVRSGRGTVGWHTYDVGSTGQDAFFVFEESLRHQHARSCRGEEGRPSLQQPTRERRTRTPHVTQHRQVLAQTHLREFQTWHSLPLPPCLFLCTPPHARLCSFLYRCGRTWIQRERHLATYTQTARGVLVVMDPHQRLTQTGEHPAEHAVSL